MHKMRLMGALVAFALTAALAQAMPVLLTEVPSYSWYHGCSPTAAGQLFGYWDLHGFSNLFDAAGADVYLTSNVQDQISSPAHNAKYDYVDDPLLPDPPDTSIADFMGTSVDPLTFGGTWLSQIDNGCDAYAAYRGYSAFDCFTESWGGFTWADFVGEIDAARPMLLAVDSSGDGEVDHSITGIGYEDRGAGGLWYACFNTWHEGETVNWYQWGEVSSTRAWGVYAGTYVLPPDGPPPVPEPASIMSLFAGLALLGGYRLRRKQIRRA